jgi:hypothetical protein
MNESFDAVIAGGLVRLFLALKARFENAEADVFTDA